MDNYINVLRLTAKQIRENPETFDFHSTTPPSPGCPACIIGWLGAIAGSKIETLGGKSFFNLGLNDIITPVLNLLDDIMVNDQNLKPHLRFYLHMDRVEKQVLGFTTTKWIKNAAVAADCIDALADEIEENETAFAKGVIDKLTSDETKQRTTQGLNQ